ncbi:nucleotidyltransferase family protein [Desulfuromonas thiophila]|uniref:nucleotidyltransferase family protein n=1 Tax=Desulfuromonas thiophila TaxID=57664 RepID=UPI0024A87BEF|nr:nucleotidyltransferase family protein [Desulfuromonas thiophila]
MGQLLKELEKNRRDILAIAARYHADNVRLFGSVAKGDDGEGSDVDFLVDFQPGTTLLDQLALIDALFMRLGRKVDVVSERALNKHLRQRILKEAVLL